MVLIRFCFVVRLITSLVDNERGLGHSASVVVEEDHAETNERASTIISRKVLIGCGAVAVGTVVATSVALTGGDSKSSNSCQDVVITPGSEVSQCPVISGNLIISNDLQGEFELDDYLPNLQKVEGSVELVTTSLTSFEFTHQEGFMKLQDDHTGIEVGGDIRMFLNPSLEHVDLSDVTSIENSLIVDRNAVLSDVNFLGDKKLVIEKNVEVKNNPMLESLELATTEFIGGLLEVESNENMQVINFLALQAVGFIVLSESPSLQNFCTESIGCFPVSELSQQAARGNVNVLDSVQLCETTEVVAGEPFCVTTDPVTNEPINCPLFDYLNEPTDRSCADYLNENAAAGCENYDQETLGCSQLLPPEPSTPPPTPFEPLCRQGQTNFCEFYQLWFIGNGDNRQCNTYNSERGSCSCVLGGNPFNRVDVGEAVCVQGQCDQFCDLTTSNQRTLCSSEEMYCTWIGLSVCNYQAMCLDDYCAPLCTYPEVEWPATFAPSPSPPTSAPSSFPTAEPTIDPSAVPTSIPSYEPTFVTNAPSSSPTNQPTPSPTDEPTAVPTGVPSSNPTVGPTGSPSPLTDENIRGAIVLWCDDPDAAEQEYDLIANWDMRLVTDLSNAFMLKRDFNDDISEWDVSSVTTLFATFPSAFSFNADISEWDVSSVTTLYVTFDFAESFNADISEWDTSSVTTLYSTFASASSFDADISQWDVSSVTTLSGTFWGASFFNADISEWDVSRVTSLYHAFDAEFNAATSFNADISGWDVSKVTTMVQAFYYAIAFNRDLTPWDVSQVTTMSQIFLGNSPASNIPLSGTWCDNEAAQREADRGWLTLSCSFKVEDVTGRYHGGNLNNNTLQR